MEKRIKFNYYKEYFIGIAWLIPSCIVFYCLSAKFLAFIVFLFTINDIVVMIINRKTYKRVIEVLKTEKNIIYQYDNKFICTDNYLISYSNCFFAVKYEDIYYVYKKSRLGYNEFYKYLHIVTKDNKKYYLYYDFSQMIKELVNIIKNKNENVVVINEAKRKKARKKLKQINEFLKKDD